MWRRGDCNTATSKKYDSLAKPAPSSLKGIRFTELATEHTKRRAEKKGDLAEDTKECERTRSNCSFCTPQRARDDFLMSGSPNQAAEVPTADCMDEDNQGTATALDFSSLPPLCVARKAFSSRQVMLRFNSYMLAEEGSPRLLTCTKHLPNRIASLYALKYFVLDNICRYSSSQGFKGVVCFCFVGIRYKMIRYGGAHMRGAKSASPSFDNTRPFFCFVCSKGSRFRDTNSEQLRKGRLVLTRWHVLADI